MVRWALYLLPLYVSSIFYLNMPETVITGYNDELLFHKSASFGMLFLVGTTFCMPCLLCSGCNSKVYQQVCEVV